MLQAIERYMKQAIVDKVPSVSSSALVSSLVSEEAVLLSCGWVNESQGLGQVPELNKALLMPWWLFVLWCLFSVSQPG